MHKSDHIIWVDKISFSSLIALMRGGYDPTSVVYCDKMSFASGHIITFLSFFKIWNFRIELIQDSLADFSVGSQSFGMKLDRELPRMCGEILSEVKGKREYLEIRKWVPSESLDIFLERKIGEISKPFFRFLYMALWYQSSYPGASHVILYPYLPLTFAFPNFNKKYSVAIVYYAKYQRCVSLFKNIFQLIIKRKIFMASFWLNYAHDGHDKCYIGVQYAQGLNLQKRSDTFWCFNGNIDPTRVVVYFDSVNSLNKAQKKILCHEIEKFNMKWAFSFYSWKNTLIHFIPYYFRKVSNFPILHNQDKVSNFISKSIDDLEIWQILQGLLLDIKIWFSFYKISGIRVVVDFTDLPHKAVAQSIALNLLGGIRVGIQRSVVNRTTSMPGLQYSANHVYLIYGREVLNHQHTSKLIKSFIVCGYPFDYIFYKESEKIRKGLDSKFKIALYDNAYTRDGILSKKMMEKFMSYFLKWCLEDDEVALILKEKKPLFLNQLIDVNNLMVLAQSTGRFIRLDDAKGRFPSDASRCVDMAVGIGISSAVMESVISGKRGIHCDLSGHDDHPYYQWGNGKIIFDDIDKLMVSLKKYKIDPKSQSGLGDWSHYVDSLDPYRDGLAGSRIAIYLNKLMDEFNLGKSQEEIIRTADKYFSQRWGSDKVFHQ